MNTFKIVLIGPTKVGKTTFLNRHLTKQFTTTHDPTLGVDVHPLRFNTNYGNICLNIWDCSGDDNFGGLRDGYYLQAQGCILMVDLTQPHLTKQLQPWLSNLYRIVPDCPVVVCGNKCDIKDIKILPNEINRWLLEGPCFKGVRYYDISVKDNYNLEKPFHELCKRLTGHDDLVFLDN